MNNYLEVIRGTVRGMVAVKNLDSTFTGSPVSELDKIHVLLTLHKNDERYLVYHKSFDNKLDADVYEEQLQEMFDVISESKAHTWDTLHLEQWTAAKNTCAKHHKINTRDYWANVRKLYVELVDKANIV